jgi:hypothetical protein
VSFEDAEPELKQELDKVPTRFRLDGPVLDTVISAGQTALRNNAVFRSFIRRGLGRALAASLDAPGRRAN